MCVKAWWTNIAICALLYVYVYLCWIFGELLAECSLLNFMHAISVFCKCVPTLVMHAHTDTEHVCACIHDCSTGKTPKGKFLKFKNPIQVKLKLLVTESWSQLYVIQCYLTEDTLLVCEWWNAEHLQIAHPYSNNGESSLA